MAEREGFEPSVRLPAHVISNHAPSATRSPLLSRNNQLIKPLGAANSNEGGLPMQAFCKPKLKSKVPFTFFCLFYICSLCMLNDTYHEIL